MKRLAVFAVLALGQNGLAGPPPPIRPYHLSIAADQAKAELDACVQPAGSLIGDVVVDTTWQATASKSIGATGPAIAACVRDALKKHYQPETRRFEPESFTLKIGTTTQVLPPGATLIPIWRAALAPRATKAQRDAFAKLVPVDYTIDKHCIRSDRPYARDLERPWIGALTVISFWDHELDRILGRAPNTTFMGAWDGTGIVTLSMNGLCVETFDAKRARSVFDEEGSCWAGSPTEILVAPREEFPHATYLQVSAQGDRTCAVTTTGAVTCCGPKTPELGKPPATALHQIATGDRFSCGLDAAGAARCWGTITTAPKGAFTKLVAGQYRVCGLHRDGSVACWPQEVAPKSTFVDVAVGCGVRADGTTECWGRDMVAPPGRWKTLAIDGQRTCGIRSDQSIGCFERDDAMFVSTPSAETWTQIAVAEKLGACGLLSSGAISCIPFATVPLRRDRATPPTGTFTQITGHHSHFCAVSTAGAIACWGDRWPHPQPTAAPPTTWHGTIVDDRGAPIAGARVESEDRNKPVSTTTLAHGGWSLASQERTLWLAITAPKHEEVRLYGDASSFVAPIALRPASTVDIDATCDGKPCSGVEVQLGRRNSPTLHDDHVAPGTYRMVVWSLRGTDQERMATVDIEMPYAVAPQRVRVALKDTGTGHTLHGTTTSSKPIDPGMIVELTCGSIVRKTWTDKVGAFDLNNVPPLPCTLVIRGLERDSNNVDINSFADVQVPLR